ncbi:hypothetical protein CesoFtcFv8_024975 [Champsocephalus esox]|uniref:Uncharacterized protein n=1 Tax=Champsocephalus esox TaxID=159716 RepID=A0AAN8GE82_9TELE|nr:hypothetical protein CesoFtcFv8_024975 [Champsocephalus esox]
MKGGRRDERKELEATEEERYTQRGRQVGGRQEKEMRKKGGIDTERKKISSWKERGGRMKGERRKEEMKERGDEWLSFLFSCTPRSSSSPSVNVIR